MNWSLDPASLARINVVGTSGSGKTTFSRKLAATLGIPAIELDRLYWEANWTQPNDDVFFERIAKALDAPNWVLDGNYDRTVPVKWRNVTTVIWLDYSFARTFAQSIRRAVGRAMTQEELWPGTGNRESFRQTFLSKQSVLLWMIKTHGKMRRRYQRVMNDPQFAALHFIRLQSPREARLFLEKISAAPWRESSRAGGERFAV
jgi:adenylate kinase family enzyme